MKLVRQWLSWFFGILASGRRTPPTPRKNERAPFQTRREQAAKVAATLILVLGGGYVLATHLLCDWVRRDLEILMLSVTQYVMSESHLPAQLGGKAPQWNARKPPEAPPVGTGGN